MRENVSKSGLSLKREKHTRQEVLIIESRPATLAPVVNLVFRGYSICGTFQECICCSTPPENSSSVT